MAFREDRGKRWGDPAPSNHETGSLRKEASFISILGVGALRNPPRRQDPGASDARRENRHDETDV